jgi:hypothetical protein
MGADTEGHRRAARGRGREVAERHPDSERGQPLFILLSPCLSTNNFDFLY